MKLCPQCHRAVDSEADGITLCCANASLEWHCTKCGKVSEGFAFPYGRCPRCGGELAAPHARRIDDSAALQAIRMAFEIELGGRAFYQRAAAQTDDKALSELFARFALMEGEHMETLARRYHIDAPAPSTDFKADLTAIFGSATQRPNDPDNLFRTAIGMEQRAAEFFDSRVAQARAGSAEQRLFRELAAEEHEHAKELSVAYARWRFGQPGQFRTNLLHPPTTPVTARVRMTNAAAALLAHHDAQRIALCCGEQRISYGALREQVMHAAAVLRVRGVAGGERVAVKLPDGSDWVNAYLGAIWAGGVAVAVNPRIPASEWQYILDEAGFQVIVAETLDDTPPPWRERVILLADWQRLVGHAHPLAPEPMHPDAPAFWCHSSGTSGKPKAVVHAQRAMRSIEQVSSEALGISADDRLFASSKLFFSYPLTNSLFAGLKLGASVVLDPAWPTAQGVAASVEAQRPSVLFSVPSLYRNLLREGLAPRIAGAGVRLCVSAGEALPASLRDAWREQTDLSIVDGYGASETLILAMLDRGDGQGFMPSPGVRIEPFEQADADLPTRIRIHAPTLALGYLDRPKAQAETFLPDAASGDVVFCPADLFARADGGGWRFAGREDSLVKIGGRWVDLVELEQRLTATAAHIVEAAAVCVPDADGVDAVALFYVAVEATLATATDARLRDAAQDLPHHQRPRWLYPVEALPRGPTGKLQRSKLRELHQAMH